MVKDDGHTMSIAGYKSLFDSLYPPLCLFANKYLDDLETSKDVVQEVFIKVWEQKVQYINWHAMKSLLYKSVRNRCLDVLKSKHFKMGLQSSELNDAKFMTEDFFVNQLIIVETYAQLEAAIKKLPEKSQKVIRLSLDAYTNIEIAEEMCVTKNTVKSQKRIAYNKLRQALGNLLNFL